MSGKLSLLIGAEEQRWADAADRIRNHRSFADVLRDENLAVFVAKACKWAETAGFLAKPEHY